MNGHTKKWMAAVAALALMGTASHARGGHGASHASSHATGEHMVSGYTTRSGTYVAPHFATNPNATRNDNYSTRGNSNPHTGTDGTKPRDEDLATLPH